MTGVQFLLPNLECASEKRLGIGIAALCLIEIGEVVETGGKLGVLRSYIFLADGKCALEELLSIVVTCKSVQIQCTQVVEARGNTQIFPSELHLAEGKCALVEQLCIGVTSLV